MTELSPTAIAQGPKFRLTDCRSVVVITEGDRVPFGLAGAVTADTRPSSEQVEHVRLYNLAFWLG